MELKPGQVLTLKHPGNGHIFDVTVVRIGKSRVTCEVPRLGKKAYEIAALVSMVQAVRS